MNVYKFNTRISGNGTITLPYGSDLFNTDVEVSIVPKHHIEVTEINNKRFLANDFINKWKGCVRGMENISDEELKYAKHEYLKQKYA